MKAAIVHAISREDYPNGWWAAHRSWPSAATVVEVVTDEHDPDAKKDEPSIEVPDERPEPPPKGTAAEDWPVTTKFYKHGLKRHVAKHRIGQKTLRVLREQTGYLTVELREVEHLSDIKLDEKTGMLEISNDFIEGLKVKAWQLDDANRRIQELEAQVSALTAVPDEPEAPPEGRRSKK